MPVSVRGARAAFCVVAGLIVLAALVFSQTPRAGADVAGSNLRTFQAGTLSGGDIDTCAVLASGSLRCWGSGNDGRLGYGNTNPIGDNELPSSVGPVDLGAGRTAVSISAGYSHTCAVLDDGTVRCWGDATFGALGYGNTTPIGDNETPGSVGPVSLGAGRTAVSVATGANFTCALLDNGAVRCWGSSASGQLGYGNTTSIGDDELPSSVGPVNLGTGRTAVSIAAGDSHVCAILDNGSVRCWGFGGTGRLGYANSNDIGDDETPGSVGPVDLGTGRTAVAITAASSDTCALLDNGAVRCWGNGASGRLGLGNTNPIGDNETPGSVAPVDLGLGRTAIGIDAGTSHTCALLDNGSVRCWGNGANGRLGYNGTISIGDDELPSAAGPVDLGAGHYAVAIMAGGSHSCALLDDGTLRCWGLGTVGRLGYGNTNSIGDDETPGSAGPVSVGGILTPNVADVSDTVTLSRSTASVGDFVVVRWEVANRGPDTATGVRDLVFVPPGAVAGTADATQGTYDPATGFWSVGALAPGQGATLLLTATISATGTLPFTGESFSPVVDDRKANNGSASLLIAGSLTGPTGPAGPTATGPTGPAGPAGPSRLAVALPSAKLSAKAKKNLVLRYAATEAASVAVKVLKGKKVAAKKTGRAKQGANSLAVKMPKRPGTYTLELSASTGSVTAKDTAKLTVSG